MVNLWEFTFFEKKIEFPETINPFSANLGSFFHKISIRSILRNIIWSYSGTLNIGKGPLPPTPTPVLTRNRPRFRSGVWRLGMMRTAATRLVRSCAVFFRFAKPKWSRAACPPPLPASTYSSYQITPKSLFCEKSYDWRFLWILALNFHNIINGGLTPFLIQFSSFLFEHFAIFSIWNKQKGLFCCPIIYQNVQNVH